MDLRPTVFMLLAAAGTSWANGPASHDPSLLLSKLHQAAPCVDAAAAHHGVNPWILKAILKVESGFDPTAMNRNANGTVDLGIAQINSMHLPKLRQYGITATHLMDGCSATYVAAWHLANQIRIHGHTWYGIASYHSTTPCQNTRYSSLLWNTLTDWRVVPGPKVPVRTLAQCGYFPPASQPSQATRRAAPTHTSSLTFDASN